MYKYVCVGILLFLFSDVYAGLERIDRPRADSSVTDLFLNGTDRSLEAYSYRERLTVEGGTDSYVYVNYPVRYRGWLDQNPVQGVIPDWGLGYYRDSWSHITNTWRWWMSSLNQPTNTVYFDAERIPNASIYPSFSEQYFDYPGQCVAFAKIATQENRGSNTWRAGKNVMERAWDMYNYYWGYWFPWWHETYDPSPEHRGRMVAFFGWWAQGSGDGTGTKFPQSGQPGHVGIFLKYAYDSYGQPIGFWIVDENYQGNAQTWNPDGRIRKHLILNNPVPRWEGDYNNPYGHTYAGQYFFVDIPVCNGYC